MSELASRMPWVLFTLQDAVFALHSSLVTEMVITPAVRPLPYAPPDVLGVVNLRGRVLPLYDLRSSLGMPSGRDERSALIALLEERKLDHVRWLEKLEHAVTSGEPFPLSLDPHGCAFGKWYDHYRAPNVLLESHLKRFDAPHRRIHALGGEALGLAEQGRRDAAVDAIARHRATTLRELVTLFDGAKDIVETTNRQIAIVTNYRDRAAALMVDAIESVEHLRSDSVCPVDGLPADTRIERAARTARGERLVMLLEEGALDALLAA